MTLAQRVGDPGPGPDAKAGPVLEMGRVAGRAAELEPERAGEGGLGDPGVR